MPKITFEKERVQVIAPMHSNLREIAVANKIPVYQGAAQVANCRGNGRCGTCRVELSGENIQPRNAVEEAKLKGASPALRLACQIEVLGDLVVKTQGEGVTHHEPEPVLAGAGGSHGSAHAHAEHPPVPYFVIAGILFVMTVLTIAVSFINLGKAGNVVLALAVASFKASLVMLFFMHLKYEKKILVMIALAPFLLAAILAFALFPDIVFGR